MPGPLPTLKKKGPRTVDPGVVRSRSRGALLGLAVGDALGATHEHRRLPAPAFPQLLDGPQTELRGGGPHGVRAGQVTDDTQMACCLAGVLRALRRYDPAEVMKQYLALRPHAVGLAEPVAELLDAIQGGAPRELAAREAWFQSSKRLADNGALARTAPIGVHFSKSPKDRIRASLEDAALTHFDPRCQLACVALNASIAAAIQSVDPPKAADLLTAAGTDLSLASASLGKTHPEHVLEVKDASELLRADLAAARDEDPKLYGPELHLHQQEGYVRVAFRLAYWELLHAPSFEAALVDVVNRGGDTDTNGAVAGALLGAYQGEEQIPERWKAAVLEALFTTRGPLREVYHPEKLLGLIDA